MKGVGSCAATTESALCRGAFGAGPLDRIRTQLSVKRVVPGLNKRHFENVAVIDVFAKIGTPDGITVRADGGILPAAISIARMPGLHELHSWWHFEAVQSAHHFFERERKLAPVVFRAPEGIEPQYTDLIAIQLDRKIKVTLQMLKILARKDTKKCDLNAGSAGMPYPFDCRVEASGLSSKLVLNLGNCCE